MTDTISREHAIRLLDNLRQLNHTFGVAFKKKDGTDRIMGCRFGVKRHLKGGRWANGKAGKPVDHGLVVVFDMVKRAYRSVPVDRIEEIHYAGHRLEVA